MSLIKQGPTGVFDSTGGLITRLCDLEIISATATFTVLEFKFPTGETEIAASSVTWPNTAQITLRQIKRFQVATGQVLAHFLAPKP